MPRPDLDLNISELLGASTFQGDKLTIYIPSRTRDDRPINQRLWIEDGLKLLAEIGDGATVMPPVEGVWRDTETKAILRDFPVLIYCFVKADLLLANVDHLRDFLHRLGSENDQNAVAFEFSGEFCVIESKDYD